MAYEFRVRQDSVDRQQRQLRGNLPQTFRHALLLETATGRG